MKPQKHPHSFILVLSSVWKLGARLEDALYEAGCDDGLLFTRAGIVCLELDREAPSLEAAIFSAVRDVERASVSLRVVRIEPGDQVTAAEIARRTGLTREYIRLLVEGTRGAGNFPTPHSGIAGKTLIWSWAEVACWLLEQGVIDDEHLVETAVVLRDFNAALEIRGDRTAKNRTSYYLRELRAIKGGADEARRRSE